MNNAERINQIIDNYREEKRLKEKMYSDEIAYKKRSSSGYMYLSDINKAFSIINDFKVITEKWYADYETIALSADRDCRMYYDDTVPAYIVKQVADFIDSVNDSSSDISVNFNASFDGIQLGDVGSINYTASTAARMAQSYWANLYYNHPEITAQRDKAAQEKRSYAQEHNISEKDVQNHKSYLAAIDKMNGSTTIKDLLSTAEDFQRLNRYLNSADLSRKCLDKAREIMKKEHSVWIEKCEKVTAQRNARADALRSELNEDLKKKYEKIDKESKKFYLDINKEIDALNTKLEQLKNEKSSLGIFALGKKHELSRQIKETQTEIDTLNTKKSDREKEDTEKRASASNEINNKMLTIDKTVEQKIPYPRGPHGEVYENITLTEDDLKGENGDVNKKLALRIMCFLQKGGCYTIPEIIAANNDINSLIKKSYNYLPYTQISGVMKNFLVNKGIVEILEFPDDEPYYRFKYDLDSGNLYKWENLKRKAERKMGMRIW